MTINRYAARADRAEIVAVVPVRTQSEANLREHWAKKASRAKLHRTSAWAAMRAADGAPRLLGPVTVTLTRIAPRKLDDDNLRGSLKAVRDGVADWLGVDDGSDLIRWEYGQEKGAPKFYAVRIKAEIRQVAFEYV